jgi:hypothetical protein
LIYSWKRERIFRACLIETSVIDEHPNLPAGLGDDNREPPCVVDLLDEADIDQLLDFFTDEVLLLNRLLPELLLDRPGIKVDLQMMLDHLPRDPEHLRWLLGKHANIILEEGDERELLFVTQALL